MAEKDWSNPPYWCCSACRERWSIALLGEGEATRLYREHIGSDPCKTKIAEATAAWRHKMRDRTWTFDHWTGTPTWGVDGHVTTTKDELDNMVVGVSIGDKTGLTITSDRDQWGTYYTLQSGPGSRKFVIAQEDGTRSFLRSLIAALQHLEHAMDYGTKDPDE